ncbi:MAG: Mu transposase domain-containing protein [Acidimicrobiales bacterium]
MARALYSVPGNLIGHHVDARADAKLVRVFHRGVLIKVHPRTRPGGRITDPADLPAERTAYALRDIEHLRRMAAGHGGAVGAYAAALLDHPLPWTKMRQTYALLGLVKRWGAERVEAACRRALEAEAVDVGLIGRMLERAAEADEVAAPPVPAPAGPARFARDPSHFATEKAKQRNGSSSDAAVADSADGGAA